VKSYQNLGAENVALALAGGGFSQLNGRVNFGFEPRRVFGLEKIKIFFQRRNFFFGEFPQRRGELKIFGFDDNIHCFLKKAPKTTKGYSFEICLLLFERFNYRLQTFFLLLRALILFSFDGRDFFCFGTTGINF